jgi:DNA polymerase I-like protein with 3'-5' exonuclease and polymerase domains
MNLVALRIKMPPELIVINKTDYDELIEFYKYLDGFEYATFDVETTGLHKHDSIIGFSVCCEETKAFYIVLAEFNSGKLDFSPDMESNNVKRAIMEKLATKKLIMHNGVFDCMMAEYCLKQPLIQSLHTDTMILAHLLDENRRVGLKELTSSIFGEDSADEAKEMKESAIRNGGKLTKACYEMWKCDTVIMGKYGAKDAWLTYRLFLHLVPQLYEQGLDKFFYEEESMPLLRGPTYDLNTTGLEVNTEKLLELKKTLEAESAELKDYIYKEVKHKISDKYPGTNKKDSFLLSSPQQLSWLLFDAYGLEFSTLTKAGKTACKALGMYKPPYTIKAKREFIRLCQASKDKKYQNPWKFIACDKKVLQKYSNKYKWIASYLEYSKKQKLLKTYINGIEKGLKYGIIQPSFLQHGTSSGRYSSRLPNFQNLPRDDKRIKEVITARQGKVYVGADYSQLEPRVFSSLSGDESLCASFNERLDFYSVIGRRVYGKDNSTPYKEGPNSFGELYPKLRQDAKTFSLAATYGATGYQIAPLLGKTPEDAERDIQTYMEAFPKVREMMKESHKLAKLQGFVTSMFGRPRRIPEATKIDRIYRNADLPYEARSLLNLSVNHRIQSTAASIVNRSAIKLHENMEKANIYAKLVLQVHDSLVVECDESDTDSVALLMKDAMEETCQLPGVKLEALPKIGKNLSQV